MNGFHIDAHGRTFYRAFNGVEYYPNEFGNFWINCNWYFRCERTGLLARA